MRPQFIAIRLLLLLCSFSFAHTVGATDKDSLLRAKNRTVYQASGHGKLDKNFKPETTRKFETLNSYLAQQTFSIKDNDPGFDNSYFQKFNTDIDTSLQAWRARADNATNEVEKANNYVDYLQPSDIYRLPVGFKKKIGTGAEITIAVSSAIFHSGYAELTVFARVKIPQLASPIFFGIQGLKLSNNGGIIGDARLVLLGDIAIPINGNNTALILKGGGFNTSTGTAVSDDKTYVSLNCNGFKEIGLTADIQFSRSLIIPVTSGNPDPTGNVTAGITHMVVSDWNDIMATVSFNKPFQVKGLNGFVFDVKTAAFDFSDLHNNQDIVYPPGYQDKYLQADNLQTWRGVYIKELSLSLPKAFKNRADTSTAVSFGVNDLIIDNNGLTGVFFANNILSIESGNAAGWKFSVDSLRLALEANQLVRAGFGGRLGLPVNKTGVNPKDTLNKKKYLEYSASISMSGDYICRVITTDSLDFDVFSATVLLAPNSYVQLSGNGDRFEAEAMLTGKIGIVSDILKAGTTGSGSAIADMKGIDFQELHITSWEPYFTAKYFGYKGELKFGGFPISFENIALVKPSPNEVGISFAVKINLGDEKGESSSFSGKAGLVVIGEINHESGGILNWQFSRIKIDSVIIHADVKGAFKLDGWVNFFDNIDHTSPRYGRGFEGGIDATFKGLQPVIRLRALFAKAPNFRYWYVDGKLDFGTGIGAAPFRVRGFAGGAYCGMKKDGYGDPFSGTGIKYSADSTAALGVKAALLFDIGTKGASGEASFEMAFNKGGGLRYIGFFGMIKISYDVLPEGSGIGDFVTKQLKKVTDLEKAGSGVDLIKLKEITDQKEVNPTEAAKQQEILSNQNAPDSLKDAPNSRPGDEGLSAYIGIQYDFNKSSLHANFDLYIKAAGGLLVGSGEGNRAGWAVFHSEPGTWYLHAGTPTNPIGIKFGIGSAFIKTSSYLMLGHDMPAFPPPPQQVISILQQSGLQYESNLGKDAIAGGRGIAFGASVQVNTGDLRFLFFYANFAAGIGFDVMLTDYGKLARCEGGGDNPIGINGWYAQGQAYVYLQGELGIQIKLAFIKKKVVIIKGGAAALLQARLPNPTWIGGALGMNISILGGLIKGHFNFKFSFGNDCKIVGAESATEEDLKIIEEVKPDSNSTDVSVYAKPTVKFTLKPGQILEIPKEDGTGTDYYQPNLDQIKMYKASDGAEVAGKITFNQEQDLATFMPDAVLSSNTKYKVIAKVSFRKSIGGNWVTYTENGQPVGETKEYEFTTGRVPVELPLVTISRLYPFIDQRNFYKDEPNKGIIRLNQDNTGYFDNFHKWKIRVETLEGVLVNSIYATTNGITDFTFSLPTNLQTNTTYNFSLRGEEPSKSDVDTTKIPIQFKFTTSKYPTLANKINALQLVQPIVGRVASDAIDLQAAVADYEGFELYELVGNQYTGDIPMIQAEADITDEPYYNSIIKPLIYPQYPLLDSLGSSFFTSENTYGIPPLKAITPSWYYVNSLDTGIFNNLLKTRMPFIHNTNKYFNLQFLDFRNQLINKYLINNSGPNGLGGLPTNLPANINSIITRGFPFMLKGQYKAKFTFVQLDGTRGTTGGFIYENPIE